MSWSYDSALPDVMNQVRFLVQDTDEEDQLAQDQEINFALSENGNSLYRAGAQVARAIALKLGRRPSARLGQIGLDADEQYEHYIRIATALETKASSTGLTGIFAGGISVSDKQSRSDDSDRTPDSFTTSLHQSA